MTISPCSQRPTNCCAVKRRWNAAPALSISERESSPLWLPLNSGKSFCQGQRGAGEPTYCTRLKCLSQWVQISIGRQCWNICPPCGQWQALPAASRAAPAIRTNLLTDKLLWRPNIVPCHSAMGQGKTIRSLSIYPEQCRRLLGDRETSRSKAPSNQVVHGMISCCPAGGFLADKAVNPTCVNHRAAVTLMRDAQIQPEPQANRNSDCLVI